MLAARLDASVGWTGLVAGACPSRASVRQRSVERGAVERGAARGQIVVPTEAPGVVGRLPGSTIAP